jgi:hypothetical protein
VLSFLVDNLVGYQPDPEEAHEAELKALKAKLKAE